MGADPDGNGFLAGLAVIEPSPVELCWRLDVALSAFSLRICCRVSGRNLLMYCGNRTLTILVGRGDLDGGPDASSNFLLMLPLTGVLISLLGFLAKAPFPLMLPEGRAVR